MFLLALLLISCASVGMSKPPISVVSADHAYTWHLDQEEIDQISSLRNQQEFIGVASCLLLSPNMRAGNFTELLPFLAKKDDSSEVAKNKKATLASKTSTAIAQFAYDADCLGAERLLNRCLKILRDRIGTERLPVLPETLQRALNEQVLCKNPFIKLLLFKAMDGNHAIQEMAEPKPRNVKNPCVIHDHTIKRRATCDGGNSTDSPYLVLYEILPDDSSKLLKIWNIYKAVQSFMVHEEGIIALHADGPEMLGLPMNRYIFFYDSVSERSDIFVPSRLFIPFRTCPTSLALNSSRKKIIAGSLEGEVGIFDLQHPEAEPHILGSVSNVLVDQEKQVDALAIDSKDRYIAVGHADTALGIWSLQQKKYKELAITGSAIDDIKFGTTDNLLFVMSCYKGLQIWSIDSQTMLYTLPIRSYEGPGGRKPSTLFIHPNDTKFTLYGHYAGRMMKCNLLDESTSQQLKYLPVSTIAFLARVGKKIHEGKRIAFADEPDLQQLYRSVPLSLQKVIAKNVSWKDWLWL